MKNRVYLETTVISYLTARPVRDIMQLARQAATEQWWREQMPKCEAYVSELVALEAGQGDPKARQLRLASIATLPRLPMTDEAIALAKILIRAHALPSLAEDDALHVGLATVHEMDILLTWNCRHIANAMALPRILSTIEKCGYEPPTITTPENLLELLGDDS